MDRSYEAEELGIYFVVLSGGEPTLRKKDIFELARRHKEQVFHLFTNGTLINEQFVEELIDVGNVTLAISLEGTEEFTDARRGKGIFKNIMEAMDLLNENGCLFGASVTYHRNNIEDVSSEEFIDLLIDKGVRFVWYFTYVPVGANANLELMATPEQRAYMHKRTSELRLRKPIFLMDFWNDGIVSGGCIAGGRRYLHINAAGEVEPCAFVHYATDNINEKSLAEALQSPLFKAYQKRIPFSDNHLRPCPLIDNPDAIRDMVHESGAYNTEADADETVDEFAAKLQDYAKAWENWQTKSLQRKGFKANPRRARSQYLGAMNVNSLFSNESRLGSWSRRAALLYPWRTLGELISCAWLGTRRSLPGRGLRKFGCRMPVNGIMLKDVGPTVDGIASSYGRVFPSITYPRSRSRS